MAYESTTVTVERSQGQIRSMLAGYRAERFAFGEDTDPDGRVWAAVTFQHAEMVVRIKVPYKSVDDRDVDRKARRARTRTRDDLVFELREQEAKRIWRVMAWNLKARLEAVQEEVETFEEAFLAHIVNPITGYTIYEELAKSGKVALPAPLPQLMPPEAEVVAA